jgi:hypothetical protein
VNCDAHPVASSDTVNDQAARPPASAPSRARDGGIGARDWRAASIREWLLLILRFAVTRDAKDEVATLAMADELDALGLEWRPVAPTFFRRTTDELCRAIATPNDPGRARIIRKHIGRIDDLRLRRAFAAAVELEGESPSGPETQKLRDLWIGLRR